jgi:hypothetical protein
MKGIIYLRTSPNGKNYVGQTVCEYERQCCWRTSTNYSSKDSIIDKARCKYGPDSFTYRVLVELDALNNQLYELLNILEIEYIEVYKSHVSTGLGYNMTFGGNHRHINLTTAHKAKISASSKGRVPKNLSIIQQSEKTKQANRDRGNSVLVYTLGGELVGEYHSTNAACLDLGLDRGSASKVLNSKFKHTKGYTIKLKENE